MNTNSNQHSLPEKDSITSGLNTNPPLTNTKVFNRHLVQPNFNTSGNSVPLSPLVPEEEVEFNSRSSTPTSFDNIGNIESFDQQIRIPLISNISKDTKLMTLSQDKVVNEKTPRMIKVPHPGLNNSTLNYKPSSPYPANIVRNQKYNLFTFIPLVLYEQFHRFLNLYFLLVCISQFFPQFSVGHFFTYLSPLAFVLFLTMIKEGLDDYRRYLRDCHANSQRYTRLNILEDGSHSSIPSSDIKVGDILIIEKDQRIPADMILLQTSDKATGTTFIRTDQLDGETDWKLRLAIPSTQQHSSLIQLLMRATHAPSNFKGLEVLVEVPSKEIHLFSGTMAIGALGTVEPLSIENTLWMNTVLASGTAIGLVIYTGTDTRAVMNTTRSSFKFGLIDKELNAIAKVLFLFSLAMSILMISMRSFVGSWIVYMVRFFILFSSIIPLSLRVNVDMARMLYAKYIYNDKQFAEGVIVRNSSIPEELGRIGYVLSDKTGTLTQNVMLLRKLHLGTICFALESFPEVAQHLVMHTHTHFQREQQGYNEWQPNVQSPAFTAATTGISFQSPYSGGTSNTLVSGGNPGAGPMPHMHFVKRSRRDISSRVFDLVQALALCHNVTPSENSGKEEVLGIAYQASSPDEVAIVNWTRSVGLSLMTRDRDSILLRREADGSLLSYVILTIFPFSSESKRMGIIVREKNSNEIFFFIKGADMVMAPLVQKNDWLQEECDNMARDGLRTLVIARKRLSEEQLAEFLIQYSAAALVLNDRATAKQTVISTFLEIELELLGITGVEDRLQEDVRLTLETLRNAGIKIWMLTGDKVETATCIGISSKLITRGQPVCQISGIKSILDVQATISMMQSKSDAAFVVDGSSLSLLLDLSSEKFIAAAATLSAMICCRCTPTQKAEIARLLKAQSPRKRVCCIGDGGNDVSMIQAADIGVGLVGKEGMQASLAADYSMTRFRDLSRLLCKIFFLLLVWHGRNSYKRTAKLSLFVIHRGFIISVLQAVFSSLFYFSPIALYQGILSIGYSTVFTTFPVFSLVLDFDIKEDLAMLYPELYIELTKGRALCFRTLFSWILVSLYQGGIIMLLAIWLFETDFIHIVSITFSALLFNELLMVALQLNTWNKFMIVSEIFSILCYIGTVRYLKSSFGMFVIPLIFVDPLFISSFTFLWKVLLITLVSFLPLLIIKIVRRMISPPNYTKLS